jgi:hypothetical protein
MRVRSRRRGGGYGGFLLGSWQKWQSPDESKAIPGKVDGSTQRGAVGDLVQRTRDSFSSTMCSQAGQ